MIKTNTKYHITIGHHTRMATIELFQDNKQLTPEDGKELTSFDINQEYLYLESLNEEQGEVYAVISFDKVVVIPNNAIIIGSRLSNSKYNTNSCRIAFYGHIITSIVYDTDQQRKQLKIYKIKERTGKIDRYIDEYNLIAKQLYHKEASITPYLNKEIILENNQIGTIIAPFGKGDKFKVKLQQKIKKDQIKTKIITYRTKYFIHDKRKKKKKIKNFDFEI